MIRSIANRALGSGEPAHLTAEESAPQNSTVTEVATRTIESSQQAEEPRVPLQGAQAEEPAESQQAEQRPPSPVGNPPTATIRLSPQEIRYNKGANDFLQGFQPKLKKVKKDIDLMVFAEGGGQSPRRIPRHYMITSKLMRMFFQSYPLSNEREMRVFKEVQPLLSKVVACRIFVGSFGQRLFSSRESEGELSVRKAKARSAAYCLVNGLESSPKRAQANSVEVAALPLAKNLLRVVDDLSAQDYLVEMSGGDFTPADLAYLKTFVDDHCGFVGLFHRQMGSSLPVLKATLDLVEEEVIELDPDIFTELQRVVATLLKQSFTISDHAKEAIAFQREMATYSENDGAILVESGEQRALFLGFLVRMEASLKQFSNETGREFASTVRDFEGLIKTLKDKKMEKENVEAFESLLGNLRIMPALSNQSSKELIIYTGASSSVAKWDDLVKGPLTAIYQSKIDRSAQVAKELLAAEEVKPKKSVKPPPIKIGDQQLRMIKPFLSPSSPIFNQQIAVDRVGRLNTLIGKEEGAVDVWLKDMQSSISRQAAASATADTAAYQGDDQADLKRILSLHENKNRLSLRAEAASESSTSVEGLTELTRVLSLYRAGSRL